MKVMLCYRHQIKDDVAAIQNMLVNYKKNTDLTWLREVKAKTRKNLPTFITNLIS